jgi:hypothetical protein
LNQLAWSSWVPRNRVLVCALGRIKTEAKRFRILASAGKVRAT